MVIIYELIKKREYWIITARKVVLVEHKR